MYAFLDRFFHLSEHGTTVRTEMVAGLTTFLTMAYIVFVNPAILAEAGMDQGAVFVATCLAAALGSALMGLVANYPIAVAPGMGLNAFFTYGVVLGLGYTWQAALGAVFVSGILFLILNSEYPPGTHVDHQYHPAVSALGDFGRIGALPRIDRAQECGRGGRSSRYTGGHRRSDRNTGVTGDRVLYSHRRVGCAGYSGGDPDRHGGRHGDRDFVGGGALRRHRFRTAQHGPYISGDGCRSRA